MFSFCPEKRGTKEFFSPGFTLIELILTIMIAAILFGIGIAYFNANNKNQTLINTANEVKTKMRLLQSYSSSRITKAENGVTCSSEVGETFGGHFISTSGPLSIFTGIVCLNPGKRYVYGSSLSFPKDIVNLAYCRIEFNAITNQVEATTVGSCSSFPIIFALAFADYTEIKRICISQSGNIYDGNPFC